MSKDQRLRVFVSSTFQDLQKERKAVADAIIRAGHDPVISEESSVTAAPIKDLVSREIESADVMVLLLGNRYGSTDESGKSYTQLEYERAVEQGKYVLAFLQVDDKGVGPADLEPQNRERLERFKDEIKRSRLCKSFRNEEDLTNALTSALHRLGASSEKHDSFETLVSTINDELLDRFGRDPTLASISSREIEQLIAETLRSLGFVVEVVSVARDGGRDSFISSHRQSGEKYAIVCKRYASTKTVDIEEVRELQRTVEDSKASSGLLVTTSRFSRAAQEYMQQSRINLRGLSLLDAAGLKSPELDVEEHDQLARFGIEVFIDPGDASKETIQNVLMRLSDLHREAGGLGLEFAADGHRVYAAEVASK